MTTKQRVFAEYTAANEVCARLILRNPLKYGGCGSLMVQWAERILNPASPDGREAGPLFARQTQKDRSTLLCSTKRIEQTEGGMNDDLDRRNQRAGSNGTAGCH